MIHDIDSLVHQLVAIDSVNPGLIPGGAGETAIARFVADWLLAQGLEVEIVDEPPGRPSVVGVARGSGGGRSLMLNAHLDTVGTAGMQRPFAPYVAGRRLFGRGAYDMKGGLAACMVTAATACQAGLAGDVIITAVADEEHASLGTSAVLRRWRADAAIVAEPTGLQLCVAHKGFVWLEIETIGTAAHGSRPDLGLDAILKMGRVLVGLEQLAQTLQAGQSHPLLGAASLHAALISGGQELSSYPQQCIVSVERRTLPGETIAEVTQPIQQILDQLSNSDPAFRSALRVQLERPPFAIDPATTIVTTVREQARAILGAAPEQTGLSFWMDSALLSRAGIPTLIFGPGGAGAHALEEWVELDDVARCAEVLSATARHFCA